MSNEKFIDELQQNMTAYLKRTIKEKGWIIKDVGIRWGVSQRRMSQMLSEPNDRLIDAVHGLPIKN